MRSRALYTTRLSVTGAVLIAIVFGLIFLNLFWLAAAVSAVLALLAAFEFRGLIRAAACPIPVVWIVHQGCFSDGHDFSCAVIAASATRL